jgi:2,4-dienoyl-CoA reductase-like NADH-dependent reductase (Old Yellow Enzyme family)/thioredoxin reductase
MTSKYSHVFEPIIIRGVLFKNRLEQAPPGCFFACDERGFVTEDFVNYFRQYARGGVAINSVGNCTIDVTESSDEPRQMQLHDPACVEPLRYFAEMCESYGAHGSLELTHNGKDTAYENINHPPYSCSSFITLAEQNRAKQLGRDPIPTIEMTKTHIAETVRKFAASALYCKQAGMKMCMVHGAHGNLIAQFVSPYFNKRTDEYGGSPENRARFAIEVLDAIRAAVGENFVIEYRISAEEFHPEQMHFDEMLDFIGLIKDKVDILHVSAGLHDLWGESYWMKFMLQNYTMDRQYNVHYAEKIKKRYPDLLVATVGSIKDLVMAEEIIASGKADFVAMNRALHADYDMPRKFAEGEEWRHTPCLRCRCFRMASPHSSKLCSVNAIWGRFKEYPDGKLPPASTRKKIAVLGGGPAGVEAMKWLLERGHDVTVYEKNARVGGHVRDAVAAPFKADLRDYLRYMEDFSANCGARVLTDTEATPEIVAAEGYDYVIAALGADPIIPKVPGWNRPNVHWAPDAENGYAECGESVVIVGGAVLGTEASINLASEGKCVTVIEMAETVSLQSSGAESDLLEMAENYGVKRYLGWKLVEITDDGAIAADISTGERHLFPADTVLFAAGLRPRRELALKFRECCPATNFIIIGDCREPGDVRDAVWSAFEATRYV